ncbi:hypothetical protein CTAYLR_002327 [Chrysophaeum taylorii]|uniref:very-long-chain (3R)-3-hydroxyacyl-CoA dehydratase n=1 Tax=Chrysophaeum taylorii TaxID=2483200 RepID=A0AAD7UI60_9STRA|nr:hypothetical protein CTAYLR_002327 [Chrysophaeum taylorii]
MLIKAYLVLYNMMCLVLWGLAAGCSVVAMKRKGLAGVWGYAGSFVLVGQLAMSLEIFHSALRLVPSPLVPTFLQVMSRLWIVVVPVLGSECKIGGEPWPGVMVLSWCAVEVIRYSFYVASLVGTEVPYPLFWLRYSVFYLLYPSGILGELMTSRLGYECFESDATRALISAIQLLYIPGSPFMYLNMVGNRKRAFKKRFAPKPPPPRGCQFPKDAKGARSTTAANRKVIAAALAATGDVEGAKAAEREKDYRFGYVKHFNRLVSASLSSPESALSSAREGLKWMRDHFEFVDADGVTHAFAAAVAKGSKITATGRVFETRTVKGSLERSPSNALAVPYDGGWSPSAPRPPGDTIADVRALADGWVAKGVIEPSAAEALAWVQNHFTTLADCHFVLIGAGSAMGPCASLLALGANVVALDIPRPALWAKITALPSAGTLTFPVVPGDGVDADRAGCDLLNEPNEIATWLCDTWLPSLNRSAKVVIGNYTYLDGDLHVKLSLCADAVIDRLLAACRDRDQAISGCAFLCTPTDLHVVPEEAYRASKANRANRSLKLLESLFFQITGKLEPNYYGAAEKDEFHVCNGLSVAQGPNYALAKRIQHWRAMLAAHAGHLASSTVAPSTATLSVIHNRTFAWAYGGMPAFNFEIFKQETTTAVMAALLVHDLLNVKGPKHPAQTTKLKNPLMIFSSQSVHGGLWRSPYAVDSIGEVSALIYFAADIFKTPRILLAAATLIAAATAFLLS